MQMPLDGGSDTPLKTVFVNPQVTMNYNGMVNSIKVKDNKTFHIKKIKAKKRPFNTCDPIIF